MNLVTGAANFLGSAVAHRLAEGGSRLRVAVFPGQELRPTLAAEVIELHPSDRVQVGKMLEGVQVFYHCANVPPGPVYGENFEIASVLFEVARERGIRVVLPSTVFVYGRPRDVPVSEEYPVAPLLEAGLLKLRIEELLRAIGGRWVVCRLPALLGSGLQVYVSRAPYEALVAGEEVTLPGDGDASVELLHVLDAARALILAGQHPDSDGEVFNVPGHVVKVWEYFQLLVNSAGMPNAVVRRPFEVLSPKLQEELYFLNQSLVMDGTKIRSRLGFEPSVSLVEAIRETLAWVRGEVERGHTGRLQLAER
jgi:nucleoside-diphosphate-sugar epimerase